MLIVTVAPTNKAARIEGVDSADPLEWGTNGMTEGFEVAQICLGGHMVNSSMLSHPDRGSPHCQRCGAKTIMACPMCHILIRGPIRTDYALIRASYQAPPYCHQCGAPYPWTQEALDAARKLASEIDGLSAEDRAALVEGMDALARETPSTELAASRVKRVLGRVSGDVYEAVVKIVTDVATEAAKKMIFGP